MYYYYAKLNDT